MRRILKCEDFKAKFIGSWEDVNDYVYSREQVSGMLERSDISKERAEEMLRMRYEIRKGEKVVVDHER